MSRFYDRARGARSAALTPAGPRLRCCNPGNVNWGLASHRHRFRRLSLYCCLSYNELVPKLGTRQKYLS